MADRLAVLGEKFMRRAFNRRDDLAVFVLRFSRLPSVRAQTPKPVETIPVSQIHAGMHGVAYTVFQGTQPESMDVEVLGHSEKRQRPKGDIILVR